MIGGYTRTCVAAAVVVVAVVAVVVAGIEKGIVEALKGQSRQTGRPLGESNRPNSSPHLQSHCCYGVDEKLMVFLIWILPLMCFGPGPA